MSRASAAHTGCNSVCKYISQLTRTSDIRVNILQGVCLVLRPHILVVGMFTYMSSTISRNGDLSKAMAPALCGGEYTPEG